MRRYALMIGGCSGSSPFVPYRVALSEAGELSKVRRSRDLHGTLTTSFALLMGNTGILIDNGLGVAGASDFLLRSGVQKVRMFQTHYHGDHVDGLPLNACLFSRCEPVIYAPQLGGAHMRQVFEHVFASSHWPVPPRALGYRYDLTMFNPGNPCSDEELAVGTMYNNHPGGAVSYRFNLDTCSIVIATDHELTDPFLQKYAEFVDGADILIADVQYLEREYEGTIGVGSSPAISRAGWGHSTPEMLITALSLCDQPPRQILVTHHDPMRDDHDIMILVNHLRSLRPGWNISACREGDVLELGRTQK